MSPVTRPDVCSSHNDSRAVVSLGGLVARCSMGSHERFVIQLITTESFRPSGASDLASLSRATARPNSAPMSAADLQGKVISDRLLDLHLHQLASHLAIRSRVGRPVEFRTELAQHNRN